MREDLSKNFRDISDEHKSIEENKLTIFDIIIGLFFGMFFYFGYYVLMTDYFKVNPFKFPYILISMYFAIATLLFPYVSNKVNIWIEGNKVISFFSTSKLAMPFAYVFAPIIFIIDLF